MPSPIPMPVRQAIFQRYRKGVAVATLAEELELSERTVRHLVRRFAARGQAALTPDYARCAPQTAATAKTMYNKAVEMRRQHPSWGGGLIRVLLHEDLAACPSERTLQRWFRRAGLLPAPPGRRPASDEYRARRPHEVWQMDAAERMLLASGERVSWLRLVDECSGAVVQTTIFPPGLLEFGGSQRRPRRVAPGFFQVGTAAALSGRQRHTLGIARRFAYRSCSLVDRPGCGHAVESAALTSGQRRGRTLTRHGQTLGRAEYLCRRARIATAAR
jgi:transposase